MFDREPSDHTFEAAAVALDALAITMPTTTGGTVALIGYVGDLDADALPDGFMTDVLAVVRAALVAMA